MLSVLLVSLSTSCTSCIYTPAYCSLLRSLCHNLEKKHFILISPLRFLRSDKEKKVLSLHQAEFDYRHYLRIIIRIISLLRLLRQGHEKTFFSFLLLCSLLRDCDKLRDYAMITRKNPYLFYLVTAFSTPWSRQKNNIFHLSPTFGRYGVVTWNRNFIFIVPLQSCNATIMKKKFCFTT